MENITKLVLCHLLGDYVLQNDYIANTKGTNWYHIFVHCALYCLPFTYYFGINYKLTILFIAHIVIDSLKARYNRISYTADQLLHYIIMCIYFI